MEYWNAIKSYLISIHPSIDPFVQIQMQILSYSLLTLFYL
jgi:hypothetical protein